MISLRAITRVCGSYTLGPLSLNIGRGEYWVILGPSGAGKSMLLHTIAGIHQADQGSIAINNQDITFAPTELRQLGLVFQKSALFPHLSVAENISYGLWAHKISRELRQKRVRELVAALNIEVLLTRPTATLSGGEAQKVAIARALALKPQVLLLDEPLSPIDYSARLELQAELKRIHKDFGLTVLHVTHSHEEAKVLGDHCAIMLNGRIVQSGFTEAVFKNPRCFFVAHFLGGDPQKITAPSCGKTCLQTHGYCDQPEVV
ncbi:MAG: ATP-binding cassette domain-containing protein [Deltaproteobacteria bacterium]|nr:ATP-binding cassette domain-containing protein [Deltaproteobacteria bacterium]